MMGREREERRRGRGGEIEEVRGRGWNGEGKRLQILVSLFCTLVILFTDHLLSSCKNLPGKT